MPSFDVTSKQNISRFLFTARTRNVIDNATYLGLTELLEEVTTPRPQTVTAVPGATTSARPQAETDTVPVKRQAPPPTPVPPAPPVCDVPPPEPRIATARRKMRERVPDRSIPAIVSRGWSKLIGDVLANVLLYIGVVLSAVAIFSFFAFGHFGRVVTNPDARPLVFVMVPLVFAGMTRLLRKQVAVQASADATGVIGALTLPIMLSGLFRDGSDLIVPDASGSARWVLYAVVGLICAAVYLRLARGRRVYGYLVAPMLWASVGALGLYFTFGVSSYQLYAVLGAMVVSVVLVAKRPTAGIAVATGRVAVVAFPAVLLTAIVFAFRNGDDPLGPSPAVAAGVTGAMLLALSLLDGVWADLDVRSRSVVRTGLVNAGYVSLGVASLLTVSWLASPQWIGPMAMVYGTIVWMVHERVGGSSVWVPRVALITVVSGAFLSLLFTAASIVVLVAANIVAVAYLLDPRVEANVRRNVLQGSDGSWLATSAVWAPVALGVAGLSRLDYPLSGWAIVGVGMASVATRWFRGRAVGLSAMARYPGLTVAVVALIVALGDGASDFGSPGHTMVLVGIAVVAGASSSPWWARGWVTLAAGFLAVITAVAGPNRFEIGGVATATVALALLGATQIPRLRRESPANAAYGITGSVLAVLVPLASGSWGVAMGIAVVAACALLLQGALCERGDLAWVVEAGRLKPSLRRVLDAAPTALASAFWLLALTVAAVNADSTEAIATASVGWAVAMALLAFAGSADRVAARMSVYGFSVVGIAFAIAGANGWIVMAFAVTAVGVLFVMEQRSVDLHLAVFGTGATITWLAAEQIGAASAQVVFSVYGGVLLVGTSMWALASSRTVTTLRRPFVVLGSVMMAVGTVTIVLRVLAEYPGGLLQTAEAGIVVLGVAAASAFSGYVFRRRWVGVVVSGTLPLGYVLTAWTSTAQPLHPAVVAPVVGVLVILGFVLPDRRVGNPLVSPASAMMLGSILTAWIPVVAGIDTPYTPWTFVLVAVVVAIARLFWDIAWLRYLSAVLWIVAAGEFSPEVLLGATVVMVAVTIRWERLASGFEATVLRWATAVLVVMSFGGAVDVFEPSFRAATMGALGLGSIAATLATTVTTTGIVPSIRRWWPQLAVIGRVGMLTGVVLAGSTGETAALFSLATWAGLEAAISARHAVVVSSRALAWLASTLAVISGLLLAGAAGTPLIPTAFMWWFIGLSGLVAWTTVVRRSAQTIWRGPLGFYAHGVVTLSTLIVASESGTPILVRAILTASVAAYGATWLAVAHRTRSRTLAAAGSIALASAWCVGVGSLGDTSSNLWRWAPAFIVAAGVWRVLGRSSDARHSMWTWAAGVATVTMFSVLVFAAFEPGDRTSWLRASIVAVGGAVATYRSGRLVGMPVDGSVASRALLVGSSWLLAGWYQPGDAASAIVLVVVSAVGAGLAVLGATRSADGGGWGGWTWVAVHTGAVIPGFVVFGWPDPLTVFVLLVVAASTVGHGVLSGSRRLTMAGVEAFIVLGAALLFDGRSFTAVTAAIIGSGVVLIATETERLIADARGERTAGWIQLVEWLGLLAVPTTATIAGLESLTYVPLLAVFGTCVLAWGIVTQVRRRVLVGVVSIFAGVILAVATPIAAAAALGMATAGGVGVTFVIGVAVIGIAILLERYHDTVGARLSRLSDSMAEWE